MRYRYLKLPTIALLVLCLYHPVLKSDAQVSELNQFAKMEPGLSEAEIARQIGQPDKKTQTGPSTETWYYGQSVVFFTENTVTAWSDKGEIESRARALYFKSPPDTVEEQLKKDGWVRDWKYKKPVTSTDVLQEMLPKKASNDQTNSTKNR